MKQSIASNFNTLLKPLIPSSSLGFTGLTFIKSCYTNDPPWTSPTTSRLFAEKIGPATTLNQVHAPLPPLKKKRSVFFLGGGIPSLKLTVCPKKWWFPSSESPFPGGVYFQGRTVSFREGHPKKEQWEDFCGQIIIIIIITFHYPRFP